MPRWNIERITTDNQPGVLIQVFFHSSDHTPASKSLVLWSLPVAVVVPISLRLHFGNVESWLVVPSCYVPMATTTVPHSYWMPEPQSTYQVLVAVPAPVPVLLQSPMMTTVPITTVRSLATPQSILSGLRYTPHSWWSQTPLMPKPSSSCDELRRQNCVTGEMWKNKPPFWLVLVKFRLLGIASITLDVAMKFTSLVLHLPGTWECPGVLGTSSTLRWVAWSIWGPMSTSASFCGWRGLDDKGSSDASEAPRVV